MIGKLHLGALFLTAIPSLMYAVAAMARSAPSAAGGADIVAATALGQLATPTTRPSTVGTIAQTIGEVNALRDGATVPAVSLVGADGVSFDLRASISNKPTVLVFYRGGWCQNCMRQLRGIESVVTDLSDAGYQVLAICPDKPERLRATSDDSRLTYPLLSDADAVAMKAFGVAYLASTKQFEMLEQASGASHHVLPVPTIYVLGTDGTIRFAHFDPDYSNKMNFSDILREAKAALTR